MKTFPALLILLLPVFTSAQINCPAFGRLQSYEKFEILLTWNTVDPYYQIGGIELDDELYGTGEYANRSMAPGITFNYYADDITLIRLKGIYTMRNVEQVTNYLIDTFGTSTNIDTKLEQTLIKVAPGFGWVWFVSRFSFYGGFEVPYTYHSDMTVETLQIDSAAGSASETRTTTTIPGGFSVGLGCFAGSTFYFPQWLGIGFEIASAYQYSMLGGDIASRVETDDQPPVVTESSYFDQKELWKFAPLQASLHLSIRF
jgi:hypothetical protein